MFFLPMSYLQKNKKYHYEIYSSERSFRGSVRASHAKSEDYSKVDIFVVSLYIKRNFIVITYWNT